MMNPVTSFLSTGWCLWCTQWKVSWALDGVYDVLSDKFPEHWVVFMMCSVMSFLSTGWCLWCAQWRVSWALDGVYDVLSDEFPEHWMVFMMCSVMSFLGTGWCLWCIQWQFSWVLDSVPFCRYWYLSDWNQLHESFQMDIFWIKFYLCMCFLIFLMTTGNCSHLKSLKCLHACLYFPFWRTNFTVWRSK